MEEQEPGSGDAALEFWSTPAPIDAKPIAEPPRANLVGNNADWARLLRRSRSEDNVGWSWYAESLDTIERAVWELSYLPPDPCIGPPVESELEDLSLEWPPPSAVRPLGLPRKQCVSTAAPHDKDVGHSATKSSKGRLTTILAASVRPKTIVQQSWDRTLTRLASIRRGLRRAK